MLSKLLPHNEHVVDRAARIALGLVLLSVALLGHGAWGYLGLVPLLTGVLGSCPIYTLLGASTCKVKPPTTI
ncbi:MAG: DUF2892 domain-containing protein [Polyangiaceae bacterium]